MQPPAVEGGGAALVVPPAFQPAAAVVPDGEAAAAAGRIEVLWRVLEVVRLELLGGGLLALNDLALTQGYNSSALVFFLFARFMISFPFHFLIILGLY